MKIYFSAPLIYQNEKGHIYNRITNHLKENQHNILTYKTQSISQIRKQSRDEFRTHYDAVVQWISECDLAILEASFPSTIHIGHEISLALETNKPTIILYEKEKEPFFLQGINSDKLFLVEYSRKNLEETLSEYLEYAKEIKQVRFNIIMEPNLFNFIKTQSKHMGFQ